MTIAMPQVCTRPRRRILLGADTFCPNVNGAAKFTERLATGLAARGHDVHVVCPSTDHTHRVEEFGGATLHRVRAYRTPFHPTFRVCLPWHADPAVARVLSDVRPEVVHTQSHFVVGRALVNGAAERGLPTVATNHFMPENLLGYLPLPASVAARAARWGWRDLGKVYGKADILTAPTPRAVDLMRDNGFGADAHAVSCGIDTERYEHNGTTFPGTVLFVGRLDREKRVCELLRAVARMADPRVRVEIVGDGACRDELVELAHQLGIAGSVLFHGFVSEQELLDAYARAEVFCMPGIAELQSLATLEAMSAGKPVVAADAVALPHLVRDGHNGWLFPPGDVDALAAALRRVLGSPGEGTAQPGTSASSTSAAMGAASREMVATHALEATLDRFEDLYTEAHARTAVPATITSGP